MNQRIDKLLVKAGAYFGGEGVVYDNFDPKKFAELIVRECVEVCNRVYFDNYLDAEDFERSEEGDAIKKHFGVEE
jgi:hypothetical protein